jgi:hypothetical protein
MRIALFTPFSPEIGGGSVQFRSLLPEMRHLEIEWFYLAENAVAGERRVWLGKPFTSSQFVSDLCARTGFLPGSRTLVHNLANRLQADLYWVVAHNEGVSVAAELCGMGRKVHLTVHDDPVCMFKRSRKYRALAPLMYHHFSKLLRSADSVDVISTCMRETYKRKYNVDSIPVYRYVPELPRIAFNVSRDTLTIGHIGSVYHSKPFRRFLSACQNYAVGQKRTLKIVRIGCSSTLNAIATEKPDLFENCGELDEPQAISRLSSCDILYAMYPSGKRFECFRQTSIPMKLSTYVQAQRPIFGHTPSDSTLAKLIGKYELGEICTSDDDKAICQALQNVLAREVPRKHFEQMREELMGSGPIERLKIALMDDRFDREIHVTLRTNSSA